MKYRPAGAAYLSPVFYSRPRMNSDFSLKRHVTIRHHYEHSQSSGVKRLSVHFWKKHMYVHLGADGVCDRQTEIKTNEAVTKKNDKRSFSEFLKCDPSGAPKWTRIVPLPIGMEGKGGIGKKEMLLDGEDDTRVRKAKQKGEGCGSEDKRMIYR